MKNLMLLFIATTISVCDAQTVIFSGKIENPNSDSLTISNGIVGKLPAIHLKKDGTFRDTLTLEEGEYTLYDGTERTTVYLKPGDDLSLTLNTKEFDETIVYKGIGANENNYIAQRVLWQEKNEGIENPSIFCKLNEADFLKFVDSAATLKKDFLNRYSLEDRFATAEKRFIEYERLNRIANYEWMHGYFTKNTDFKVSANYPNAFQNLDFNDDRFADDETYLSLLQTYFKEKARAKTKEDTTRIFIVEFANAIQLGVGNTSVKDGLARFLTETYFGAGDNIDAAYTAISELIASKKLRATLDKKYTSLKKVRKGNASPDFSLKDVKGKTFSLANFRGKVVYIDLWATWCGPCNRELPHLKKIEEEFRGKNIAFVGICTRDKKESWEKFLKEKKLGGTQLFAPNQDGDFFKDYNVSGIPRFIILDKEGKIVDADAKRPSQPELKTQLESLL